MIPVSCMLSMKLVATAVGAKRATMCDPARAERSTGYVVGAPSNAVVTIADNDEALPTLGSATLSWTPPTEREDGSVLDNLAGYKVHYGTNQSNLGTVVVLDNPGLSSYVVDNLGQGTWYFAVTAYDADGRESNFSNVGSKMIL